MAVRGVVPECASLVVAPRDSVFGREGVLPIVAELVIDSGLANGVVWDMFWFIGIGIGLGGRLCGVGGSDTCTSMLMEENSGAGDSGATFDTCGGRGSRTGSINTTEGSRGAGEGVDRTELMVGRS